MGDLKSELSKKSPYYLPRHRYLELVHFCLQYPEWKARLQMLTDLTARGIGTGVSGMPGNETERIALERIALKNKIELVERVCRETDEGLWFYLLQGVTEEGCSYTYLRNMMDIPCGRNMYHDKRRAFFWRLDKERD